MIEKETEQILLRALPKEAVKPHPTLKGMSAIQPMYIIDVLNEAFGIGGWIFETEFIACNPYTQTTKTGSREMYMSAVKGILKVPKYQIHIEQFGGSPSPDMGDALKGGATDALTKCASYLGVGASIYKGQGNIDGFELSPRDACEKLLGCATLDELKDTFTALPKSLQADVEVIAMKDELKNKLS